jgi:creatinine amidohydrolase
MQRQWRNSRRGAQILPKKPAFTLIAVLVVVFATGAIAGPGGDSAFVGMVLAQSQARTETNPLWHEEKAKNYLPHMTSPEVRDLLTRTDIVLIPVPSLEQHGLHAPIGTDYFSGVERAKLIAQRTDILVAPVLMIGQAPYHMGFPGTITLSPVTMQQVYFEAAQSLIRHGFRRFLFLNSHAGNQYVTRFIIDRINQETEAVAIDLGEGVGSMASSQASRSAAQAQFDRHGGVIETSGALYLFPSLVQLDKAQRADLTFPPHLSQMLPKVVSGDQAATLIFLAEGLKPKETGKHTSAAEMSTTGAWSERDPREATAEQGRRATEYFVDAAVRFIEKWKELRPQQRR